MLNIIDTNIHILWPEALADHNRDAYVSDWALSSIFPVPEDGSIPAEIVDGLGKLWDVAHMSVADLRQSAGLSRAAFCRSFCIPNRTVQDWELGQRTPPDYTRLMIARQLGLV